MERAEPAGTADTGQPAPLTDPLALYIHWPFCLAKCPYCDFNSHVRDRIDQARFAAALRRELAHEAQRLGRRPLTSVFFGGGTPSLMDPATVGALLDDAARLFGINEATEITLEANPTSIEADRLADFRQAGINRVSVGIQSLDPTALDARGRKQYRYHPQFRLVRDSAKFDATAAFGRLLPSLRAQVEKDLAARDLCRTRAVASVIRLLDTGSIRIGPWIAARPVRGRSLEPRGTICNAPGWP